MVLTYKLYIIVNEIKNCVQINKIQYIIRNSKISFLNLSFSLKEFEKIEEGKQQQSYINKIQLDQDCLMKAKKNQFKQ
ncbi:unnamed protein product [Paramecium sonneborni]|uniref:Uncharacterized protein n=1 Tax=Paramecium sonneborni TaxID=65129 RepID=A0A8S1JW14_9CILI|nr:unnamed protein product [Paramecium sonneborni]